MSDKARGAIFNMLGDISGLAVLDAFAGSGALSLEALSRGASHATAVDVDKAAHRTIQENAQALGVQAKLKAIRANASGWSDNNPTMSFDIVLCDPPYDHLQLPLLQKLVRHLKPDGVLVLSWPGGQAPPDLLGVVAIAAKDYGDAQIMIFSRA